MNTRDLEYLVAVAQHLHFGKAADACYVSQPSMSAQLKKLEERLGVKVFERSTRGVSVTEAGELIVAQAKRILQESKELNDLADTLQNPLAGTLKLGVIPTLGPYLLPHIMPAINRELPYLKVLLHEWQTPRCLQGLIAGDLDAAILATPVSGPLIEQPFAEEPFYLLASDKNPIAMQAQINACKVNELPLMLLEEGHCLRDQALEACSLGARTGEFYATSLETLRHMVAADNGVTLVPELAVKSWGDNAGLSVTNIDPKISRTLRLVYRKSTSRTVLFKQLLSIMQQQTNAVLGEQ